MSATTRSIQATPSFGPLVAAFAAILVAMGLALALAYSQLGALQVTTAPVSGSAQSMHDHGLSTAAAAPRTRCAAQRRRPVRPRSRLDRRGGRRAAHDRRLDRPRRTRIPPVPTPAGADIEWGTAPASRGDAAVGCRVRARHAGRHRGRRPFWGRRLRARTHDGEIAR